MASYLKAKVILKDISIVLGGPLFSRSVSYMYMHFLSKDLTKILSLILFIHPQGSPMFTLHLPFTSFVPFL